MKILHAMKAAMWAAKSVYTTTTLHLSEWWQGVRAQWGGVDYNALSKKAYANPTASRGLRLIAQLMASVKFAVKLPGADQELVYEHEMVQIMERPNPRVSAGYFCSQIVTHLYCAGELFVHRITPDSGPNAGKPTANGASLRLLNPGKFYDFIRDQTDEVTGYKFYNRRGQIVTYTTDEVRHIRIYHPDADTDRGLPLLLGAARALDQIEAADEWNKGVAQGGGRIPGYFVPRLKDGEPQLTAEQVGHAQEMLDRVTDERRRANMPQVLSGAYDFKESSMTMKDADFLKANQQNVRYIAAVLGMSATLLGDEKAGSLTDAGIDSEVRAVYLLTVLPILEYVLGEINNWLSPNYGGAELWYDRDQIEALSEDVNAMYERIGKAVGGPFLTVNEARETHGWEPLPDEEYNTVRNARAPSPPAEDRTPVIPMRSYQYGDDDELARVKAFIRSRYEKAA